MIDPTKDSRDNAQWKWFGLTLRHYFQFCPNGDEQLIQKVSDSGVEVQGTNIMFILPGTSSSRSASVQ